MTSRILLIILVVMTSLTTTADDSGQQESALESILVTSKNAGECLAIGKLYSVDGASNNPEKLDLIVSFIESYAETWGIEPEDIADYCEITKLRYLLVMKLVKENGTIYLQ